MPLDGKTHGSEMKMSTINSKLNTLATLEVGEVGELQPQSSDAIVEVSTIELAYVGGGIATLVFS